MPRPACGPTMVVRSIPRASASAFWVMGCSSVTMVKFDHVRIDDGHIIERVQQADVLAQMRQLYGKALGLIGLDAMFLRL
jgi:hypothetical protein